MTRNFILGVDPGKHGGFCVVPISGKGAHTFIPVPLKKAEVQLRDMIATLSHIAPSVELAVMEDVHSIFGASAKSNFQFGWVNGAMETALAAAGIPYTKVQPKAWQKTAWRGITPIAYPTGKTNKKGEPQYKIDTKATSLLAVRTLFPNETFLATSRSTVPHDGWVDAALIAKWGIDNLCRLKQLLTAPGL